MDTLIFVSLESWDDIWRRNQFVCAELARRYPDMRILFVCPPRDVSNAIRTRRFDVLRGPNNWHPDGYANITVTRPLKLLPSTLAIGRWVNDFMARRYVRRMAREIKPANLLAAAPVPSSRDETPHAAAKGPAMAGPEAQIQNSGSPSPATARTILWINDQGAAHMVGRMGEARMIYDITDDWTQFTHFTDRKALLDRTIAADAELCRRADAVIVCSRSLYESRKALTRDIHLIPNGVDAAHYRCVLDDDGALPEACRNWPRPVFGYTGSIHADRVDVKLVEAITARMKARNMPGTIVLIGPVMLPADQRQKLEATGRVIFTGPMAYRDLPQYMRAFDVCIVPHCMTAFVESLNPIKLWEYLAAGKPIVSTDVAGFRDYPDLVRSARTADEFVNQCREALAEGTEKSELRRAEAGKHSWRSRVDEIVALLAAGADEPRVAGQ
jgi:glycosyltransferase involved in cell wall biosynthesis